MLSDRSRELLTAFVDGELTPRQRTQAEQLLRESAEARELLRRLQDDAARLTGLNPPALEQDLSAIVVDAIRERRLQPGRRRNFLHRPTEFPTRALLAAAASVLLLVAMSAYLFIVVPTLQPDVRREPVAFEQPKADPVAKVADHNDGGDEQPPALPTAPEAPRVAENAADERPFVGPPAPEREPGPVTPRAEPPVYVDRMTELFRPGRVEVTLPVILSLHDLAEEAGRKRLLAEFRKDSSFRIELPCRNATRAFDRVQSALRTHDVGLIVDQDARVRLQQPLWKTNYLVFAEDVTPEDLAAVLHEANVLDHKGKASEAQLADLVVTRLSKDHRKLLSDLLGVDPIAVPPRAAGPLGTDPHKPLPELTAGQVADALSGSPGKSPAGAARPPARQALALAYNAERPRTGSAEVRRFLDSRKPPRPGTLQILLILRGT